MRKEHEQTQRVKAAKRQENIERSAKIHARERKQQTARIRRYYSDYQLRMRSKMLRRRTKEEKVFVDLTNFNNYKKFFSFLSICLKKV